MIVESPLTVLAAPPLNVMVPGPDFTNPPLSVSTPLTFRLPAPSLVSQKPPVTRVPLRVSVPESTVTNVPAASVIPPAIELSPPTLRSAPRPEGPMPLTVKTWGGTAMPPFTYSPAPELTMALPATVPRAPLCSICSVPALTVIVLASVLVVVSTSVPVPALVKVGVPLSCPSCPANVVTPLLLTVMMRFAVRLMAPAKVRFAEPPMAKSPLAVTVLAGATAIAPA